MKPMFDKRKIRLFKWPGSRTIYAAACVLLLWQALHLALGSRLIPSPGQTLIRFWNLLPNVLSQHLLASLVRIMIALVVSLITGGVIGLWIGMNKRADQLVTPVVYLLYPLPKIAFLPILMVLFGLGNAPKILLIFLVVVFQIIIAARDGVREIPQPLFHSVLSLDLSRKDLYRHLVFPAVLPRIMTALRISIGISISVLFFAESFATTYGIGYYIMNSWLLVNYVDMFSGILALSLLGFGLFSLLDLAERRFCRWTQAGKPDEGR